MWSMSLPSLNPYRLLQWFGERITVGILREGMCIIKILFLHHLTPSWRLPLVEKWTKEHDGSLLKDEAKGPDYPIDLSGSLDCSQGNAQFCVYHCLLFSCGLKIHHSILPFVIVYCCWIPFFAQRTKISIPNTNLDAHSLQFSIQFLEFQKRNLMHILCNSRYNSWNFKNKTWCTFFAILDTILGLQVEQVKTISRLHC